VVFVEGDQHRIAEVIEGSTQNESADCCHKCSRELYLLICCGFATARLKVLQEQSLSKLLQLRMIAVAAILEVAARHATLELSERENS
jgi:hypothetical protein